MRVRISASSRYTRLTNAGIEKKVRQLFTIRVADPLLDETEVRADIQQVRCDRVFEHMEVALRLWNLRKRAVALHEHVEHFAADRTRRGRLVAELNVLDLVLRPAILRAVSAVS